METENLKEKVINLLIAKIEGLPQTAYQLNLVTRINLSTCRQVLNGTLKYILKYPTLSIVKNDTTTYDFEFKDSRTIVRVGANEYAAYMKYIKQ